MNVLREPHFRMALNKPLSVDRFLEMAERAGRVRKALDADPSVDARDVLVGVRRDAIVLTGYVRREKDIPTLRSVASEAADGEIIEEIAVAVGRAPRVDLPDAELLLPSPDASAGRPDPVTR